MGSEETRSGYKELQWELGKDRRGHHALKIGDRSIHSQYDSLGHAARAAYKLMDDMRSQQHNLLIMIGMGVGYLPQALYELGLTRALIWDPFPHMRSQLPFTGGEWTKHFKVLTHFDQLSQALLEMIEPDTVPHLMVHPGYEPYCRFELKQVHELLHSTYSKQQDLKFEEYVISERSLESIVRLPYLPTLQKLKGVADCEEKGGASTRKALLVGPGPSLKAALPVLKERKSGVLFAALQAVPLLQREGIHVDFVVVADPNDLSAFTEDCTKDFGALIAECSVHPSTLDWVSEKTFLFHLYTDQLHQDLWGVSEQFSSIRAPIATVSETLALIAGRLGFKDLLFLGMDFCWKGERYSYRSPSAPPFEGLEPVFEVEACGGEVAMTDATYFHAWRYLGYICSQIHKTGFTLSQVTEGLPLPHCSNLSVEQLRECLAHEERGVVIPEYEGANEDLKVAARKLLERARDSEAISGKKMRQRENVIEEKRMRYFDELPLEMRKEYCERALRSLA